MTAKPQKEYSPEEYLELERIGLTLPLRVIYGQTENLGI